MGSNPFMISEIHKHASNHPPMVSMDNGHFVAPMDYTFRGGSNSHWNFGGGYNEHHHHPSFVPPLPGWPPVDHPYSHPVNTYVGCPVGHFNPSHFYDPGMGHIPPGHDKRKSNSICERSAGNFYDAGSSHTWTRNVRSRSIPEFVPPCMTTTRVPSYASYYQPSANYPVPVHPVNLSTNVMSQGGWNSVPYAASHGWASPPDSNGLRHENSQFNVEGGYVDINACHNNPFFQGNLASSQHPHVSHVQSNGPPSHFNYTNGSSSSTSDLHFPSQNIFTRYSSHNPARGWDHGYWNGRPSMAVPRLPPIGDLVGAHGRLEGETLTADQRNGRPSMVVPGLPPIVNVVGDHDRLEHETFTADDQLSFNQNSMNFPHQFQDSRLEDGISYEELLALEESEILTAHQRNGRASMDVSRLPSSGYVIGDYDSPEHETLTAILDQLSFNQNSMNFPDQFQDMRLDIDDMSYEELLALVERIGNVSTGLSEEAMFECLSEQVYCSIDRTQEEASCPVCLEEYKNGEKVGRMKKCGHNYHVDCIKKWLVMKKVCPVCKSECSNQA